MTEWSFLAPQNAWFGVLVPIVVWLQISLRRTVIADLNRLVQPVVFSALWEGSRPGGGRPVVSFGFAMALVVLSLMRPTYGFRVESFESASSEIVIALDVSDSMRSSDQSPTRLAHARRKLSDLLDRMQGERVALVFFAGMASPESPLTEDHELIREKLQNAEIANLPIPGSRIDIAIREGLALFDGGLLTSEASDKVSTGSRAIIVISDGDANGELAGEAAVQAVEQGVRIFVLGVGTTEGAPVPFDRSGQGYRRLSDGRLLMSKLNEPVLSELARVGEGQYAPSTSSDADLRVLYDQGIMEELGRGSSKSRQERRPIEIFQFPLALAFLILAFDSFRSYLPNVSFGKSSKTSSPPMGRAKRSLGFKSLSIVVFCFAVHLLASSAYASDFLNRTHRAAKDAFEKGDFEAASTYWKKRLSELGARALPEDYYNLGSALYRMGDYGGAKRAYESAEMKLTDLTRSSGQSEDKHVSNSDERHSLLADVYHNKGNTELLTGSLNEAIESYSSSLSLRPNDEQTKANLLRARQMLELQKQSSSEDKAKMNEEESKNSERSSLSKDSAGTDLNQGGDASGQAQPREERVNASNGTTAADSEKDKEDSVSNGSERQTTEYKGGEPSDDLPLSANEDETRGDATEGVNKPEEEKGNSPAEQSAKGTPGESRSGSEGREREDYASDLSQDELDKALRGVRESDKAYRKWRLEKAAKQQMEKYGEPADGGQDW